jgi:magnesium-protoporphyrin O-methyltransferase
MPCSQCQGIEDEFSLREARGQLRRYRRSGPSKTTRELTEVLIRMGVEGSSVLDIGGGVGAIQHALLEAGARHAHSVDASAAYAKIAREEADRRGLAAKIEVLHDDFVEMANSIPSADIVTLDKVICCYHDMHALVAASAARANRLYGLIYPRDAWWLRPIFAAGNVILRLRRSSFRIFLHAAAEVEATVTAQGLRAAFHRNRGIWQVAVFTT